jgi:hypothetical protein
MIELYALKPFALGVFITWFIMKKIKRKCKCYLIREI